MVDIPPDPFPAETLRAAATLAQADTRAAVSDTVDLAPAGSRGWLVNIEPGSRAALSRSLTQHSAGFDFLTPDEALARAQAGDLLPAWWAIDLAADGVPAMGALLSLRRAAPTVPMLALVPAGDGALARQALDAGAFDFCDRSAPAWEIRVRVQTLCRDRMSSARVLQVGNLVLDLDSRSVHLGGSPLNLSARLFELLHLLMCHAGEILSPARIERALDLPPRARGSNVIEVHVHHLRRRIGPHRLSTVRGRGYVLHASWSDGK